LWTNKEIHLAHFLPLPVFTSSPHPLSLVECHSPLTISACFLTLHKLYYNYEESNLMVETDTSQTSEIKIRCSRERLVETVSLVSRAVSSRTAVQVLSGILVTVEKEKLRLAATDMELALTASFEVEVAGEGASVVPGRVFADACRSLPTDVDEVTLEQPGGSRMIEVCCGSASYRLNVSTTEDFPRLPEIEKERAFKVDRNTFLDTAGRVARAASRDESRPVLTGLLIHFEPGSSAKTRKLTMAATDSYRLAVKETELEGETPELAAIVPARAIAELARIPFANGELELAIQDNHTVFVLGSTTLSTRRIDGQFPNHRQLLPESFTYTLKLPRLELLDVVRRVAVMAQRTSPVRLSFQEGALTVSAQTQDVGEASETLPVSFSGEPFEIGFNADFLREGIESVVGDELELNLISPIRPGLLRAEGDSFWYLIMPIRLAG
jgi:DNA polymerase-3 subunit beta